MKMYKPKDTFVWDFLFAHLVLAVLLGCLLLCSCAAIDEDTSNCVSGDQTASSDNAITFDLKDVSSTRTPVGTIDDVSGLYTDGFGVFACHTGLHTYVSSDITSNFMYNQKVTFDNSTAHWTYEPLKYWPNGETENGDEEYISFFAYGPHSKADGSDNASNSIVEFIDPREKGDPWLVYQLGGSEYSWKDNQVDLVYAVVKDRQKRGNGSPYIGEHNRVALDFHHALSAANDELTITCAVSLKDRFVTEAGGSSLTLTLDRLVLDYSLLRKAKLVLNDAETPNWQSVSSEDPIVHRFIDLTPSEVIGTVTSGAWTGDDYYKSDLGIFYIPLNIPGNEQSVEVTAYYTVACGDNLTYTGSVSRAIDLNVANMFGKTNDMKVVLNSLPGFTFVANELSVAVGSTVALGDSYSGYGDDVTASYQSSDESVATYDPATGEVTGVAAGTTTISITLRDASDNVVGSAEKKVTVIAAP